MAGKSNITSNEKIVTQGGVRLELRKDDPIYYRNKIRDLIQQAFNEGLALDIHVDNESIGLVFKADNGDKARVNINKKNH